MKISFDFDSTLSEPINQIIAKRFIDKGYDVWITTSRHFDPKFGHYNNKGLFMIAERLGIPESNIVFTESRDKYLFLEGFDMHFDDDPTEIEMINENIDCIGILIDINIYQK